MKPLAIVLYAGLHGWEEGLVAEGWRCVGFDIVDMCAMLGQPRPRNCQLVLQDVLTLHGSQFRNADLIVASPPCQAYSYRAMPWSRAKVLPPPDNSLFDSCFRIQCEAIEAAGRFIPLIVENVRGAQRWVVYAKWHFGSYYLWGDVPALMPVARSLKIGGQDWNNFRKAGQISPHWRMKAFAAADPDSGLKVLARIHVRDGASHTRHLTNPAEHCRMEDSGIKSFPPFRRREASAMLAKIPFPLAQHIARCFYPQKAERQFA